MFTACVLSVSLWKLVGQQQGLYIIHLLLAQNNECNIDLCEKGYKGYKAF